MMLSQRCLINRLVNQVIGAKADDQGGSVYLKEVLKRSTEKKY